MRKRNGRKLELSRETLQRLDDNTLDGVFGAATGTCAGSGCISCDTACSLERNCPITGG